MKKVYLPIFWKFVIAIIFTVSVFGILNISFVWNKVFEIINNELTKRYINIIKLTANQSENYILYNDLAGLHNIIENLMTVDEEIAYCFIIDKDNHILSHSFINGIPKGLAEANTISIGQEYAIKDIHSKNFHISSIKDFAVPIHNSELGTLRVGINENYINKKLNSIFWIFIIIFSIFTLLGFIGAFIFSYIITKPLKLIKSSSETFVFNDINNLTIKKIEISNILKNKKFFDYIKFSDETDDLVIKFNEMIERLIKTYNDLLLTQEAMIQSEKLASIGTLVSGLAHEINNPLSGLLSCIRRINQNPNNIEQNKKYFTIMEEAINKLQFILSQLLNFTRYSSEKFEYTDFSIIVSNAINLINLNNFNKIEITTNINKNSIILSCKKNQMEQMFYNLFKNSIDAIIEKQKINDNHFGQIGVFFYDFDAYIEITVQDNGIGIEKDKINKIFDPFFTTKEVGKGTGLGSYICYNIIKEHKGSIIYESVYDEFTKVIINLPKKYE